MILESVTIKDLRLFVLKDKSVWVAIATTGGAVVFVPKNRADSHVVYPHFQKQNAYWHFTSDGTLIFATTEDILLVFDPAKKTVKTKVIPCGWYHNAYTQNQNRIDGARWVYPPHEGLLVICGDHRNGLPSVTIYDIEKESFRFNPVPDWDLEQMHSGLSQFPRAEYQWGISRGEGFHWGLPFIRSNASGKDFLLPIDPDSLQPMYEVIGEIDKAKGFYSNGRRVMFSICNAEQYGYKPGPQPVLFFENKDGVMGFVDLARKSFRPYIPNVDTGDIVEKLAIDPTNYGFFAPMLDGQPVYFEDEYFTWPGTKYGVNVFNPYTENGVSFFHVGIIDTTTKVSENRWVNNVPANGVDICSVVETANGAFAAAQKYGGVFRSEGDKFAQVGSIGISPRGMIAKGNDVYVYGYLNTILKTEGKEIEAIDANVVPLQVFATCALDNIFVAGVERRNKSYENGFLHIGRINLEVIPALLPDRLDIFHTKHLRKEIGLTENEHTADEVENAVYAYQQKTGLSRQEVKGLLFDTCAYSPCGLAYNQEAQEIIVGLRYDSISGLKGIEIDGLNENSAANKNAGVAFLDSDGEYIRQAFFNHNEKMVVGTCGRFVYAIQVDGVELYDYNTLELAHSFAVSIPDEVFSYDYPFQNFHLAHENCIYVCSKNGVEKIDTVSRIKTTVTTENVKGITLFGGFLTAFAENLITKIPIT